MCLFWAMNHPIIQCIHIVLFVHMRKLRLFINSERPCGYIGLSVVSGIHWEYTKYFSGLGSKELWTGSQWSWVFKASSAVIWLSSFSRFIILMTSKLTIDLSWRGHLPKASLWNVKITAPLPYRGPAYPPSSSSHGMPSVSSPRAEPCQDLASAGLNRASLAKACRHLVSADNLISHRSGNKRVIQLWGKHARLPHSSFLLEITFFFPSQKRTQRKMNNR